MKIFSLFVSIGMLAGLGVFSAQADQSNSSISSTAAAEMKIGLGARPAALGEAFVGLADDFNAPAWNPAGLAQIIGSQAGFLHSIYFENISMEYLTYAQNISSGSGLGAYLTYFNYGTLDKVDDVNGAPVPNGQFYPRALALALAYGQKIFSEVSLGGTVKYFSQSIDTRSYSAVGLDLGALVKPLPDLQFGLSLQNLGTSLAGFSLPLNMKIGAAYSVPLNSSDNAWKLLLDFNLPTTDVSYRSLNVGTEYVFHRFLAGRLGYNLKNTGEIGGSNGVCAGLGLKLSVFSLDYALVSFGDLGLTHQLMLSTDFGSTEAPTKPAPGQTVEKQVVIYRENPEDAKNRSKIQELEAQKKALEDELNEFKKSIAVGTLHPILFKNNKNDLLPSAYPTLDYLANILAKYPMLIVRIEGHTDYRGTDAYNMRLSQARVESVQMYLTGKPGIKSEHLIPIGYGKTRPIAQNNTEAGRQKNRRVEFKVIDPYEYIKKK